MSIHSRFLAASLLVAALLTGCPGPDPDPGGDDAGQNNPTDDAGTDAGTAPDGGTDPNDGGTNPDQVEIPVPSTRDPNNDKIDTDCDGLSNAEEWGNLYPPNSDKTKPGVRDTDLDGLRDGVEVGRTSSLNTSAECTSIFIADADTSSRTNPTNPDTDGDGLRDGLEDANRNGKKDPGETDPANPDTDGDGLLDGAEDANMNGVLDVGETDPRLRDMDGDGLSDAIELNTTRTDPRNPDTDNDTCKDGAEDINGNGTKDSGETDPLVRTDCGTGTLPDADGDGLPNNIEDANGNGSVDSGETNPNVADSDGDGLVDGVEDKNHNGAVDTGESNPRSKDSDCDGLLDGPTQGTFLGEDLNGNGLKDPGETDPSNRDTDGDGLLDGVERGVATGPVSCGYVGDADTSTSTDPLDNDSDNDGIADGAEDANQNGRKDTGELDPKNGADGAANTPAGQACAAQNLRQVTFKEDSGGDVRLALRPTFQEVTRIVLGGNGRGYIGYDDTNKVAFIAYKRGQAGSSTTAVGDEQFVRGQLSPAVTSDTVTTQTFTTWDGHPAVLAYYDQSASTNLRDYANSVANTLVGSGAGVLTGGSGVTGPYKIQAQYVHRSNSSVLVVLAITPASRFVEPGLFVMGDTAGGTALAQFGDADAVQCETFTTGNGMADFLFVVDDSGSMQTSQTSLGDAATAVANRLGNSQLDWRIALVTSTYTQTNVSSTFINAGVFRGFTKDINVFKSWLVQSAPCTDTSVTQCWVGVDGSSDEKTLASARAAVDYMNNASTPAAKKYRSGAKLVVIILTDVRDTNDSTPVSTYIDYFKGANPTGSLIQMHGIICDPTGTVCYPGEPITDPRHLEVIQATGGVVGSIRNTTSIQNTINTIMDSAIAASGYRTLKPPIGASVRVAVESVLNSSQCTASDLPRSRVNGFDVDGVSQALAFYGACRPSAVGTKAAISYRYWSDLTPNKDGNPPPCSTDTGYYDANDPDFCKGNLTCNRQTNRCECPSDCGGGGTPGKVCNTSKDVCGFVCAADCGGVCGSFQQCNTSTCSCQCVQSATCAPGYKFDASACGCVCDTAGLNCGSTYQADASSCSCVCKANCGGGCPSNTVCNMSSCRCEPKLN